MRYSATDSEDLAVVEAVGAFDPYLYGCHFTVFTNHHPLLTIKSQTCSHGLQPLRWAEQNKDLLIKESITYLEGGQLPKSKLPTSICEFEISHGVLYHLREQSDRLLRCVVVLVQLQQFALRLAHCAPLAAHPDVIRTYTKEKQLFYFPNMFSRTKQFVTKYQECQICEGCASKNVPLASAPEVSHPLEPVSVDLIQLPRSSHGNLYMLVIVDHISHFVELIPLPDKKDRTNAEAFIDAYFTIYGIPLELQTDGGGEFNNKLMSLVCEVLLIHFKVTVPYHPQANG
ncbi:uncharacterized protein K02A2.6-like [Penaeus monodon]|uniref:uncharacterized protein K02A2.6-like n=1 Tax=Penaeus monodon TaxID=6687 RepID=UPI0018A71969|nr:uncharacterized protein K02A2.6-like [Penaeus monodon]